MPLLSKVGFYRGKSLGVVLTIYLVLAIGALTMLVPFLMTLTTSVTNPYDLPQYNIVPRFIFKSDDLFIKYLVAKYPLTGSAVNYDLIKKNYRISGAETLAELSEAHEPLKNNFAPLDYDQWDPARLAVAKQDWEDFWKQVRGDPEGALLVDRFYPFETLEAYQDFLREKYLSRWRAEHPVEAKKWSIKVQEKAAVALLNQTYGSIEGTEFGRISIDIGNRQRRLWVPERNQALFDYLEFVATLPAERVFLINPDHPYQDFLREQHATLEKLNAAWGTKYHHWSEIQFSNQPPVHPAHRDDWSKYVIKWMPVRHVRFDQTPLDADFQRWMLQRYETLTRLNLTLQTKFASIEEIHFSPALPVERTLRFPWLEFAIAHVPAAEWKFPHPLQPYHDFLRQRYGSADKLAQAYGQSFDSFEEVRLPQAAFDRAEFLTQRGRWRWHFLTDNFVKVFDFIALKGNALWNTLLLVGASLLGALTINPMAAYALSRFRIKNKRIILAFLLIPMAFPGEVAQIPSFLLTRDLGLLNTYWALILPGLAHGFSIFLLKGFFDGLPRELYEAAELDGANEWQIYRNVTFPLCKPILALTVIGVVIGAYSGFMWAFLVCPDQQMWTLAVWIFQYSVDAVQAGRGHLQMAALVLMSIPTLIVFLFTQKIIMKGIVLPTMK